MELIKKLSLLIVFIILSCSKDSSGDPFLFNWDIEGVGTYTGESVEVFIGTMGTYDVTHTVFNQGGAGWHWPAAAAYL
jgi:hypothetical protein